jgi:hypothetical protein
VELVERRAADPRGEHAGVISVPVPQYPSRRMPPRRADVTELLETVLFCAIATVLIVRTELYLTNYPQVGGNGLHIAHLLWGGLLMLVSLGILLAFVVPSARRVAAVLGGIGLGLFIDEVGKFVTSDNNYFFKPAATIIYCFFVAFFLVIRQVERTREFTHREYLLNTIEAVKELPMMRMSEERRQRALRMLERTDPADPLVPYLQRMLDDPRAGVTPHVGQLTRAVHAVRARLRALVALPGFRSGIIVVFAAHVVFSAVGVSGLLAITDPHLGTHRIARSSGIHSIPYTEADRHFVQVALAVSTAVAIVLTLIGIERLLRRRMVSGYVMLEYGLLVSIFLTEVFAFVHSQFAAALGLVVNLVLLVIVRAALAQENDDVEYSVP